MTPVFTQAAALKAHEDEVLDFARRLLGRAWDAQKLFLSEETEQVLLALRRQWIKAVLCPRLNSSLEAQEGSKNGTN